ncbi:MAG: DMT family transporter [Candidatus Azosocius agrarius]|nr:MAG: DMT family transporter [Gammaproteobacteria bacterium]
MIFYALLWKIISYIMFSFCNSIIRYLVGGSVFFIGAPIPIYIIVMYSYMFGAILIFPYIFLKKGIYGLKTKYIFLHILRLIFFVSGFLLWGVSFKYMTLVQVVVISFGSHLLTIVCSVIFLKEYISFRRSIALIISISGVIVTSCNIKVLHLGEFNNIVFLFPIFASFLFSLEKLMARKLLLLNESSNLLTFYVLFFTVPVCFIPVMEYGWIEPEINHYFYFLILGFFFILSIYSHNKAHMCSEVTLLMPFFPFKLIISCVVSFFFFGEIPNILDIFIWVFVLIFCSFILFYSDKKN